MSANPLINVEPLHERGYVITVRGELDAFTAPSLRAEVGRLIDAGGAQPLVIDLAARSVSVGDGAVALTKVEFDLLAALAKRAGDAVSREALSGAALGEDREGDERTLDVHMSRLRKKLGAAGRCIATVWGVGYRLEVPRR